MTEVRPPSVSVGSQKKAVAVEAGIHPGTGRIFLDEAQSISAIEISLFLARIGEGGPTVIDGAIDQCDRTQGSGSEIVLELLQARNLPVPVIESPIEDTVRPCSMHADNAPIREKDSLVT